MPALADRLRLEPEVEPETEVAPEVALLPADLTRRRSRNNEDSPAGQVTRRRFRLSVD